MESRAKLLGHPIHTTLIVFPLGLLGMAEIFDLVAAGHAARHEDGSPPCQDANVAERRPRGVRTLLGRTRRGRGGSLPFGIAGRPSVGHAT